MANIFRGPLHAPIFPRPSIITDVVPNVLLGLAALLTPLSQPFSQHDWPNPVAARITPQAECVSGFTTRGIPPPPPFYQNDQPNPNPRARDLLQTWEWTGTTTRGIPPPPPFYQNDQPNPTPRANSTPQDFQNSSVFNLKIPFKNIIREAFFTRIDALKYLQVEPPPNVLTASNLNPSFRIITSFGTDHGSIASEYSRGSLFGSDFPNGAPTPLKPALFVAPDQISLAGQHSCGALWSIKLQTGASPPLQSMAQAIEQRDPSHLDTSWVLSPALPVLFGHPPALKPAINVSQEPIFAATASVWGPEPSSAAQRQSQIVSSAPQQIDYPEGYARVYNLPVPPGGGQSVTLEWYADLDWLEDRPSSIETGYTPLFVRAVQPALGPQVVSPQPDTIQPNSSAVYGQTPPTGAQVPLRPLPQAAPQQTDQGYGLVDTYGWSRFPPASIAPDVPKAYFFIPQAAPQHADYLQANESRITGQQPPTGLQAPINRISWTDPDQKTIASQQSYGALFGPRKPPNYFINVKMVPGDDDVEADKGRGALWSLTPPTSAPAAIFSEFQVGTHQRAIADEHSRGWTTPRIPPTAGPVPLRPSLFAAPQQSDEGRALISKQQPAGAQKPPLASYVYAQRLEDLESEGIFTSAPLVSPPPVPALGPIIAASGQTLEQIAGQVFGQPPKTAQSVPFAKIYGNQERPDLGYEQIWSQPPQTGATAFWSAEFFAAQDVPEQSVATIYATQPFPTSFLAVFTQVSQERFDTGFANISQSTTSDEPVFQFPPLGLAIFVPAEIPDQGNAGAASLSRPFLPLPTPALGPSLFSSSDNDYLRLDVSAGSGHLSGLQPPTGSATPITYGIFSAPDQTHQANEAAGGIIRPVWQRHVPTTLSAPHFYPLGFGFVRLGGIQLT